MDPANYNPAPGIEKYLAVARKRHLKNEELSRLGEALRTGEPSGILWTLNEKANAKHRARTKQQVTNLGPYAAAAMRLIVLTGARLRKILHLRWVYADLANAVIGLADSKTSAKTIALNGPAVDVLTSLTRINSLVIPSLGSSKPRSDLKGP